MNQQETTKDRILTEALRLFAAYGYDAVSVAQIAGAVGIKAPSLYNHYKSKRDIFDHILERICQLDARRTEENQLPQQDFDQAPETFSGRDAASLKEFLLDQFAYWSGDEFARNFRRMLTLEQYKSPEMMALYQKVFAAGPVDYTADLFRQMMDEGSLCPAEPAWLAAEFYAPLFLALSICDAQPQRRAELTRYLADAADRFLSSHTPKKEEAQ